jgi:hypothetical protein
LLLEAIEEKAKDPPEGRNGAPAGSTAVRTATAVTASTVTRKGSCYCTKQ